MLTGIIEEIGKVISFDESRGKRRLTIGATQVTRELKKGDSVAVSGVCLTAVDLAADRFSADLAAETVARTSLSRLRPGSLINLELPVRADSRMGGHVVQGHVDGVARLVSLERIKGGDDYWLLIQIPSEWTRYVVWKGSITIEGVSLTVAQVENNKVGIAIIPHTWEATNLHSLQTGDPLNIEVDIIAKYTEKMLRGDVPAGAVTLERLISEGF